ncbi:MAG: VCBS repeat-containing protein [Bacteroidetes bacterium]|nr:VCBS repeat-containing protein [Bacteroidota bacterium]
MKNLLILILIILGSSAALSQTFTDIAASAGVDGGSDWQGVSFGDFDNDGDEDIFIIRHDGPPGALYQNNGDETFTDITNSAGLSESENEGGVFGDYNNDGLLDLYVSNELGLNFLFRNNGDETFTDVSDGSGANLSGLAISSPFGDYNNDGLLDIYVVNLSGSNVLLRNNGDGTFTNVTDAAGVGNTGSGITAVWSDFNLDGKLDLYVANQNANVLYQNNGQGIFTDITAIAGVGTNATSEGTASADFDNDGDMDYVAGNLGYNYKYHATENEPLHVYCYDFDRNNSYDIVLGYYNEGECYPVRGRECSSEQIPNIKENFPTYDAFGRASLADVYGGDLNKALHSEAYTFATS